MQIFSHLLETWQRECVCMKLMVMGGHGVETGSYYYRAKSACIAMGITSDEVADYLFSVYIYISRVFFVIEKAFALEIFISLTRLHRLA